MDSLDNTGYRILSQENGFQYLELSPFEITFQYEYDEDYFYRNQTVCMSYNGNLEDLNGQIWETRGCDTIYNEDENNSRKSTLKCSCNKI